MEKITQKAIEGGYNATWDSVCGPVVPKGDGNNHVGELFPVLDPLFWQALGKECGWENSQHPHWRVSIQREYDHHPSEIFNLRKKPWEAFALRFHSINLTESWSTAVAYLESITN